MSAATSRGRISIASRAANRLASTSGTMSDGSVKANSTQSLRS
jgi:hypothetical protein